MAVRGVDTIDHTLTGAILAAHGYAFVTRYYAGHTSTIGKEIIRAEVVEKTKAGVRIVSNWETDGKPADTIAAGEAHARAFLKQHAEVGGPTWAPCYFSIDHAVPAGGCDLYFTGVRTVLGVDRVGCYGEGDLIRHLKARGLISLGWLAMATAWPGGRDTTGCDLHQTGRGTVAGHDVDFNTALSGYYGGWLDGETSPQEDDMDQAQFNMLMVGAAANKAVREAWLDALTHTDGVVKTVNYAADAKTNPTITLETLIREACNQGHASVIATQAASDPGKLAAALAPLLPAGTSVDTQTLVTALQTALAGMTLTIDPPSS